MPADDHELLTAVAGDNVRLTARRLQRHGDKTKRPISFMMSIHVVIKFEMVDIDQGYVS